jgi:hypothetical protein
MAQVVGTPASGKTTMAKLLHSYILEREPDALVVRLCASQTREAMEKNGGQRDWPDYNIWDAKGGSVLIVDEAQELYWDTAFWVRIKDNSHSRHRIITLASYESTGSDAAITPYSLPQMQVVGLYATDHGDGIKAGLLLSKDEFNDFVEKKFHDHCFDEQFLEGIYHLTVGHVGACQDVLAAIQAHSVSHTHY